MSDCGQAMPLTSFRSHVVGCHDAWQSLCPCFRSERYGTETLSHCLWPLATQGTVSGDTR
jgi:hypothetical protein